MKNSIPAVRISGALRRRAAILVVVALVSFGGLSVRADPTLAADTVTFQSPTGNVHCFISTTAGEPHFATCELRDYTGKVPTRPSDCDLDWVPEATVFGNGKVFVFGCQGDTNVNPSNMKLAYGKSIKAGEFTCTSAVTGMTCKVKSGRGFVVSKASIKKL